MHWGIAVIIWVAGASISQEIYYRRRHGFGAPMPWDRVGRSESFLLSLAWPVMWFVPRFRHPALCEHPQHVRARGGMSSQPGCGRASYRS